MPDNRITNEQIGKLVSESTCHINSLSISFPYKYAVEVADLNWYDILWAIDKGFLDHRAAIEHAEIELEKSDAYPQAVLSLACLYPDEAIFPHSIHPYIDELANTVAEEDKGKTKDKMMYVLLKWLYEHRVDYVDPLYAVAIIYDDFNFPDSITNSITNFTYYFPSAEPKSESIEGNQAMLIQRWKSFLDEQQKEWKSSPSR